MIGKLIYELTKVLVYDYVDENTIECHSIKSGFFESQIDAEGYIRKHNHDKNCFFIARTYVFNPTHSGQTEDFVTQRTYDSNGEVICVCSTHHFVINYHEMFGGEATLFKGRDDIKLRKNSVAWFYDEYDEVLCKCKIGEVPLSTKKAAKFDCLEWYDDSFLVYPLPLTDKDNHQHIISCFMFSCTFVNNLLNQ